MQSALDKALDAHREIQCLPKIARPSLVRMSRQQRSQRKLIRRPHQLSTSTLSIEVRELYVLSTNLEISLNAAPPTIRRACEECNAPSAEPFSMPADSTIDHAPASLIPIAIGGKCQRFEIGDAVRPLARTTNLGLSPVGSSPDVKSREQEAPNRPSWYLLQRWLSRHIKRARFKLTSVRPM